MHDDQERKMRELVYRLIEMAPEAPAFQEADMAELTNHPALARPTNRRSLVFVASLAAALVIGIAAPIIVFRSDPSSPPTTQPPATTTAPLASTWVYTSDNDGGTQTMTIRNFGDGAIEIVVRDDFATACSGTPSTMTGTGRIEAGTQLVIPAPMYTCDNGSEPEAEQLRDWTLSLDTQSDTLTDGSGGLWVRGLEPLWPQTSLEEVRQAQELADARDPLYTWQRGGVDRWWQPWQNHPNDSEIFARFLEEELGWEGFLWAHHQFPHPEGVVFVSGDVVFIRCAPGLTNPLYPNDPEGSGCAPTIDELRYETVKINVAQLASEGPTGIWVVTGWEMIEPFAQIAPSSDAEVTALLDAFLQARIDGVGAEEFADVTEDDPFASEQVDPDIPLLYATSTGASYERAEFELVHGPVWPSGQMQLLAVRLFAENDGTVVEQLFTVERDETGRLRLVYEFQPMGPEGPLPATTENGEAVLVEYSVLDGQVTYRAAYPFKPADYQLEASDDTNDAWNRGPDRTAIVGRPFVDRRAVPLLLLLVDPVPIGSGCEEAPAPVDAAALARSIRSDPDFEATSPVAVTIDGIPALQIDLLVKQHASWCWTDTYGVSHHVLFNETPVSDDQLVRLYLLDLPGAPARVMAIVLFNADLDQALELAAPIVDSIEFHAR